MPVNCAENANGAPGDTICIEITVDNLVDVTNAQFTLNWDPAVLDFVEVTNLEYHARALDNGAFNTSAPWSSQLGQLPLPVLSTFSAPATA